MTAPVRRRSVRIAWSRTGGLVISGTRWGDGTWAWLHEGWDYAGLGRWVMRGSAGEDPDLLAVVLISRQLSAIGVDVTGDIDMRD